MRSVNVHETVARARLPLANHIIMSTTSWQPHHHQVVWTCKRLGTREFRLENTIGRETLCFWGKVAAVVAKGGWPLSNEHSFILAFIHSLRFLAFIHSFIRSFIHSFISFIHSPIHSLISFSSFISFIHWSVYSLIHSFVHSFIHSFISFPRFLSFHSIWLHSSIHSFHFISFRFISFHLIYSFISFIHSFPFRSVPFHSNPFQSFIHFIHSFMHSFHFISFHFVSMVLLFISCRHFKSFVFNSLTSFQLTKNFNKQTCISYSHVLFSKLPPRRMPGTTWYFQFLW